MVAIYKKNIKLNLETIKMTKEEAEARIKRLEWVQSEIHRCVAQGIPVSSLKEKGIAVEDLRETLEK